MGVVWCVGVLFVLLWGLLLWSRCVWWVLGRRRLPRTM